MSSKRQNGSIVKLREVAKRITVGIATSATHAYRQTGVPLIRNTDIREGWISTSDLVFIDEEFDARHKAKRLRVGDVITVRTGNPGTSAVVPTALEGAQCFTSLITTVDKNKLLPEYLCTLINSSVGRRFFGLGEAGGAQKNVNAGTLKEFQFYLPSLVDQRVVISLLGQSDKCRRLVSEKLTRLRRRKVQLLRDLLTGCRRFPEFKDEEWFDGHVGDVMKAAARPTEWNEDKVYRLASVRRWAGGIFEREHLRGKDIKVKSLFHLEKDDILLSHIQAAYGAIARVPEGFEDAYVSSTYSVLTPRDGRIDPAFAEYLFSSRWMWHQAYLASNGFFAERLRLCFNEADFLKRPISIPANVDEQRKIAEVLTAADREIKLLGNLRAAIERQKRGLMQRLLTGEMTLPESMIEKLNAEAEAETALQQVGESS